MTGVEKIGEIEYSIKSTLDSWLKPRMEGKSLSEAGWEAWMSDQRIMTEKLVKQDWFPSQVKFLERKGQPPVDRIDRSAWPDSPSVLYMIDAHMPRGSDQDNMWWKVRPILQQMIPKHLMWADEYRLNYKNSY